jgi:hypothetical protein
MKPFKFLNSPLLKCHDGPNVYTGEWFYSVNKVDRSSSSGIPIPKYTIVPRRVLHKDRYKFTPDHERLWYFKSRNSADWLIKMWRKQDEQMSGGEDMYRFSNTIITLNKHNE